MSRTLVRSTDATGFTADVTGVVATVGVVVTGVVVTVGTVVTGAGVTGTVVTGGRGTAVTGSCSN